MIAFDIEPLQTSNHENASIHRYIKNLLANIDLEKSFDFCVTYNPYSPPPELDFLPKNVSVVPATKANLSLLRFNWLIVCSPFEKSRGRTTELFSACFPNIKIATIVYDMIPMIFEMEYLNDPVSRVHYQMGIDSILRSDVILTASQQTTDDLRKFLSPKSVVAMIGTGIDRNFFDRSDVDLIDNTSKYRGVTSGAFARKKFIFTVAGAYKSNDIGNLLEAFSLCSPEFRAVHPLVIGGGLDLRSRDHFLNEWKTVLRGRYSGENDLIFLPESLNADLFEVYRCCHVFICASLYEGFELSLTEALVSGAVCAASRNSALKEIASPPRFLFDPRNASEISARLDEACSDETYRSAFRDWAEEKRDGFRWKGVIDNLWSVVSAPPTPAGENSAIHPSPRTAFVGPLLPADSGIASYNMEIAPKFSGTGRADWYVSAGFPSLSVNRSDVLPLSFLNMEWAAYDDFVYIIGNSFHHLNALRMMNKNPGVVWLHDVNLKGLALSYASLLRADAPWTLFTEWVEMYNSQFIPMIDSWTSLNESKFLMAKPLLQNARSFIVHSEHAKSLLERDLGGKQDQRAISVIPHAIPDHGVIATGPKQALPQVLRIGMLGFMHPMKNPEITIDAANELAKRGQKCDVVIIGSCDDSYFHVLHRRLKSPLIRLHKTGFLPDSEFLEIFRTIDVAIQMRKQSNGEASGTVAHAIGLGVPVITNVVSALELWGPMVVEAPRAVTAAQLADLILGSQSAQYLEELSERRPHYIKNFSFDAIAKQILQHLDV